MDNIFQADQNFRAKAAAEYLGITKSSFWRWVREGRIPKGVHLSARAVVWRKSVLDAFIASAVAEQEGVKS
jgi:predicted DNA-binding transcriptional regulator AlpA